MARKKDPQTQIPVTLGSLSMLRTIGLAARIDRQFLDLDTAESLFCGKRVIGRLETVAGNPDQQALFDTETGLDGIFDIKGYSVRPDHFSVRLNLTREGVDWTTLGQMAGRDARLTVAKVEEIPDKEAKGENEEPEEE